MENEQSQEFVVDFENRIFAVTLPYVKNKYAVDQFGSVFRYKANRWVKLNGEVNHGYLRVKLSVDGKVARKRVHRLVAEEFLENPLNKPYVNHKDGNKLNNHFSNLEWCTASENEYHSYRVLGKIQPRTKPEHIRQKAIDMRKSGVKVGDICSSLNVSRSFIDNLMRSHSLTK
jgi:hypothetical protein